MFFISPIKTLYSIKFYIQTLQESLWKAFGFIVYLIVLGSIFLAIYTPIKLRQPITDGVEKVASVIPNIKINNGVISANNDKRVVISPKELEGYKIIFDTASTEPAYPTQMQKENILMYVNKYTVYTFANGKFQENTVDKEFNFEVSKDILLNNEQQIVKSLIYVLVIVFILAFIFRVVILTILALIIGFIIGAVSQVNLGFKKLFNLALYLQGPVFIVDLILFILPVKIMGMSMLAALIIFIVYLNLIFFNLRASSRQKANTLLDEDDE